MIFLFLYLEFLWDGLQKHHCFIKIINTGKVKIKRFKIGLIGIGKMANPNIYRKQITTMCPVCLKEFTGIKTRLTCSNKCRSKRYRMNNDSNFSKRADNFLKSYPAILESIRKSIDRP